MRQESVPTTIDSISVKTLYNGSDAHLNFLTQDVFALYNKRVK